MTRVFEVDSTTHSVRTDPPKYGYSSGCYLELMFIPLQVGIGLAAALLAVVLVAVYGVFKIVKTIKPFVVNTVLGLVLIVVGGAFGFGVQITPVLILLVAFGGLPAAVLAIVLAEVGLVFEPAVVIPVIL